VRDSRWADLGRRAISAAILAPIALVCLWLGGLPYDALMVAAGLGLAGEWALLCGQGPWRRPGLLVWVAVLLAAVATLAESPVVALALLLGGCAVVRSFARPLLAFGVLYVGLPMVALLWLRAQPGGREVMLFLVFVIWASDIGAFLVGRLLRGPKLAPRLSPGKTWSGAVGGLVAVLLVALAMTPHRYGLALALGAICQAGDLLESAIKRHVGVKDSGHLIPGHGGLLDRLDGLLAAAPVAALVMLWSRGEMG